MHKTKVSEKKYDLLLISRQMLIIKLDQIECANSMNKINFLKVYLSN